ncbi:tetratricopeptide repeat protein [Mesorhizobium amorphae]|uniref:Uncharacterized protein n=1 Tax=Mesorhizobium amorphae CCNWGS0123 TaxID=1082933 RepID=G6Y2Q4_9HYPH|nr:tetratricopeptide repeat protein [Mesorhizobium amorphae]ANT54639.1 hypothetical protein A6B35_32090 [Mesorhizobium amorphae CCNWGS0123]EHH14015.1 hypothetical protein MEA186_00976 [Mesorhizobium amorphae CCNWGS0123]
MKSYQNLHAIRPRSFRLASIVFAILTIVPLSACSSWNKSGLSVKEAAPPDLLGAKDIDPAMRERIARAVGPDTDERALQDELKQQPGNVDAAIRLTKALVAQKRESEALQILDNVLLAAPNNLRALNAKGVVFDLEGRHDAAQALYRQALKTEPGNQMLRNNLNLSLALDGTVEPSASARTL